MRARARARVRHWQNYQSSCCHCSLRQKRHFVPEEGAGLLLKHLLLELVLELVLELELELVLELVLEPVLALDSRLGQLPS